MNNRNINHFRQPVSLTAEPLAHGLIPLVVEITIAKYNKCLSLGSHQITTELIKADSVILASVIHKLLNAIWNRAEFPGQLKVLVNNQFKKGGRNEGNNFPWLGLLPTYTKYWGTSCFQG